MLKDFDHCSIAPLGLAGCDSWFVCFARVMADEMAFENPPAAARAMNTDKMQTIPPLIGKPNPVFLLMPAMTIPAIASNNPIKPIESARKPGKGIQQNKQERIPNTNAATPGGLNPRLNSTLTFWGAGFDGSANGISGTNNSISK
jgi:hypothetical protein